MLLFESWDSFSIASHAKYYTTPKRFIPILCGVCRDALSPEKSPEFRDPRPHSGLLALVSGIPGVRFSKSGIPEKVRKHIKNTRFPAFFVKNDILFVKKQSFGTFCNWRRMPTSMLGGFREQMARTSNASTRHPEYHHNWKRWLMIS